MNVGEVSNAQARRDQAAIERRDREWWASVRDVVNVLGTKQEQDAVKNRSKLDFSERRKLEAELRKKYGEHLTSTGYKLFKDKGELSELTPQEWDLHKDSALTADLSLQKPAKWLMGQIAGHLSGAKLYLGAGSTWSNSKAAGDKLSPNYPQYRTVTVGTSWRVPITLKDPSLGKNGVTFQLLLGNFRYWDGSNVRFIGFWESTKYLSGAPELGVEPLKDYVTKGAVDRLPMVPKAVKPLTKYLQGFLEKARAAAQPKPRTPAKPKAVVDSAEAEKLRILDQLAVKVKGWPEGLAHVEKVRADYKKGRNPKPDDLKKIRNFLYKNRMRGEADHFRKAAARVAELYLQAARRSRKPSPVNPKKEKSNTIKIEPGKGRDPSSRDLAEGRVNIRKGPHANKPQRGRGQKGKGKAQRHPKHKKDPRRSYMASIARVAYRRLTGDSDV